MKKALEFTIGFILIILTYALFLVRNITNILSTKSKSSFDQYSRKPQEVLNTIFAVCIIILIFGGYYAIKRLM